MGYRCRPHNAAGRAPQRADRTTLGLLSTGHDPACAQRVHDAARFAQGALIACAVARLATAHRRLIDGNVLQGEGPHYRAPPGLAWSEAQGMDGPRR
jgi:hypothetical protein